MVLVFDLGASQTRISLSSDGVQLEKPYIFATDTSREGPAHFIEEMKHHIRGRDIEMIAGGIAGTIDRERGVLLESPNLPEWRNVPMKKMLGTLTSGDVVLENDTAVVGLGEIVAQRPKGIAVYVTVSTGVNAARFVDGQIDRSTFGFEAGRILIPSAAVEQKSLEALIGGHAMQQRYGRLPRDIDDPKVWEVEAGYLAEGLYNMILLWSPEVIILGGSMMKDISIELVKDKLQRLPVVFPVLPELISAELGALGGLYGALEMIRQHSGR